MPRILVVEERARVSLYQKFLHAKNSDPELHP